MVNQFLALALFIMLLAFFIILNSMSSFDEEKAETLSNSLAMAFSVRSLENDLQPNVEKSEASAMEDGNSLDKIRALFQTQISAVKISQNRFGTMMKVTVPARDFEQALTASMSAGAGLSGVGQGFAPMLVSFMGLQDHVTYEMDLVLNIGRGPGTIQNQAPEDAREQLRRAAFYAQSLETLGLPKKLVTSGLGPGESGTLDIYFRRYEPLDPGEFSQNVRLKGAAP